MPVIINNRPILPLERNIPQAKPQNNNAIENSNSFSDVLKSTFDSKKTVKLSKHAEERLTKRNINLTSNDLKKVSDAVDKAEAKGIKEALIMLDGKALVTNIKNRTIITAISGDDLKDNVFTNIDGAMII